MKRDETDRQSIYFILAIFFHVGKIEDKSVETFFASIFQNKRDLFLPKMYSCTLICSSFE